MLALVELEKPELDETEVIVLVGTRELVVVDGRGTKALLEANGTPPLVEEREVRSPVMLCANHKPGSTSRLRYTDSLVVLIRIISLT